MFAAYNGFPNWIVKNVIRHCLSNKRNDKPELKGDTETETLFISLPYNGKEAESIVKRCKKRLYKIFKKEKKIRFIISFQSFKLSFFTSNKDKIPSLSNSCIVYHYVCPGCKSSYVGKTENTLFNRTKEHGWCQKDSAIFKHFDTCEPWNDIINLFKIDDHKIDETEFRINCVRENTKVIGRSDDWLKLSFLESIKIKELKPELNRGLKSCKDLSLF